MWGKHIWHYPSLWIRNSSISTLTRGCCNGWIGIVWAFFGSIFPCFYVFKYSTWKISLRMLLYFFCKDLIHSYSFTYSYLFCTNLKYFWKGMDRKLEEKIVKAKQKNLFLHNMCSSSSVFSVAKAQSCFCAILSWLSLS